MYRQLHIFSEADNIKLYTTHITQSIPTQQLSISANCLYKLLILALNRMLKQFELCWDIFAIAWVSFCMDTV